MELIAPLFFELSRVYTRATCCPTTCCPNEQHVAIDGNMLPGNKLLVRATCCLYLGNIFIYVTVDLYSFNPLYPATDGQQSNKLATILLTATSNMLPGVNAALVCKQ